MTALLQVCRMIGGDLELTALLRSAMDAVAVAMEVEACSILLTSADGRELLFHTVCGEHASGLATTSVPLAESSVAGWAVAHGQTVLLSDAYQDPRFNPEFDRRTGFRTRSLLCVPLCVQDRRLGVLQLLNRRDGRPFAAADGTLSEAVAGVVALAIDHAEQHRARLQAERLATVGQTVAGLAHCVKNILNGVQAGSYLVEQGLAAQPQADGIGRGWRIVSRNLQCLSDIVMDMLSFAKPREPVRQPGCPYELCAEVVELLQAQAAEAGVTVALAAENATLMARYDEAAIRRCLVNLVGNAVDACRSRTAGRVALAVAPGRQPGGMQVQVQDNGCGMPPEVRRRLFEPMFSTKGSRGTGLGLAVVAKIVAEHKGVLHVESVPGQGTTFALDIPPTG